MQLEELGGVDAPDSVVAVDDPGVLVPGELAEALLEYETLNGEESKRAIRGEDIGRDQGNAHRPAPLVSGASAIPKSRPKKPGGFGDPAPAGA